MAGEFEDLAETLQALRSQLDAAMAAGPHDGIHFQLGAVTMDFEVVVSREAGAEGGIRFGVVTLGAKGSLSGVRTHRISLTMQPVTVGADRVIRPALIHGSATDQPI